jgi:hypothetical protein
MTRLQTRFAAGATLAGFLLAAVPAFAQDARLHLPNLDHLSKRAIDSVDITLDASLLRLAAGFLGSDDREVRGLLDDLKGIYVRSYTFGEDGAYAPSDIEGVRAQLSKSGWARLVDVKSTREASHSEIYMMLDRGTPLGIAIVTSEPRSFTIVNIVGRIDLERLRKLEGQFGIPRTR